eukprot:scaffold1230_cov166-Amphora_coffeaeformis.AAC.14
MPSFMFRGNMWTSPCSYVRHLVPPGEAWLALLQNVKDIVRTSDTRFIFESQPPIHANFGLQRYANEHWIAAHPALQPCDMSGHKPLNYWFHKNNQHGINNTADMTFGRAPVAPYWKKWSYHNFKLDQKIHRDERLARREFFYMAGHIVQWNMFYNGTMPDFSTSWVWDWFPEGHLWRDMIQRHGPVAALDKMLDPRNNLITTVDAMV